MARETSLFLRSMMDDDRSVLEFLDAPCSFLNERLATHYAIPATRSSCRRGEQP